MLRSVGVSNIILDRGITHKVHLSDDNGKIILKDAVPVMVYSRE